MTPANTLQIEPGRWVIVRHETDGYVVERTEYWCEFRGAWRSNPQWVEADAGREWATSAWHPKVFGSANEARAYAARLRPRLVLCSARDTAPTERWMSFTRKGGGHDV